MTAWHASAVHALVTAGRDYLAERREDVGDAIETIRELIETSARVDLASLTVSRLMLRVDAAERVARDCDDTAFRASALVVQMSRRVAAIEDRLAALERSVDTEAK